MIHSPTLPRIIRRPPKKKKAPCGPSQPRQIRGHSTIRVYKPVEAAPLPPAPLHPIGSQESGVKLRRKPTRALECLSKRTGPQPRQRSKDLHWSWVTESLAEISSYSILGREIELLEEFRRDGDAASCADAAKSIFRGLVFTQVVSIAVILGEILLKRRRPVVSVHGRHLSFKGSDAIEVFCCNID